MKGTFSKTIGMLSYREAFCRNRDAADKRNAVILRIWLISAIVIFALSFLSSYLFDDLGYMRPAYAVIVGLSAAILLCLHFAKPKGMLLFTYVIYGIFIAYAIVTSAFTSPDYICVSILAFIFLFQVLYLDKGWRINLATIVSAAVYLTVVCRYKDPRLITDEIVNVLCFTLLSGIIGTFTRKAQLENFDMKRTLENFAYTDQLTGLPNRRSFFDLLSVCERADCTLPIQAFAMIDIDRFKDYNDRYGHQSGDECLRRLGECFRGLHEQYGVDFFRYGGEEFVAVNRSFQPDQFMEICDELRKRVSSVQISNADHSVSSVTISIGVACLGPESDGKYETLLSMADRAMYLAKSKGRDQLELFSSNTGGVLIDDSQLRSSFRKRK